MCEKEPLHMRRMPSVLYVISEEDIQNFDAAGKPLYDTPNGCPCNPRTASSTAAKPPSASSASNLGVNPVQ